MFQDVKMMTRFKVDIFWFTVGLYLLLGEWVYVKPFQDTYFFIFLFDHLPYLMGFLYF